MDEIKRAIKIGEKYREHFDWSNVNEVWSKLDEELEELKEYLNDDQNRPHQLHELGDVILTLIQVARHLKLDPQMALKMASDRFENRYNSMSDFILKDKKKIQDMSLDQLNHYWMKAKSVTKEHEEKALILALEKT